MNKGTSETASGSAAGKMDVLRRLQLTELEILQALSAFCEEHEICWFMDSGTVLGAMRHGGFIPWDDDIDVGMLRADYDRFLKLAKESFPQGYSVHTAEDTDGFAGMFAKVYKDGTRFETAETRLAGLRQGIFIDIFPWDPLDRNPKVSRRQRARARFWQSVSYLYHSSWVTLPSMNRILHGFARLLAWIAHHVVKLIFNPRIISRQFKRALETECPGELLIPFAWPQIEGVPADVLTPTAKVEFEGSSYPAPADPETYLTIMYGDWRKLPPSEQRRTHLPLLIDFADETPVWRDAGFSSLQEGS